MTTIDPNSKSVIDGLGLTQPKRVASDKLGQEQFLQLMIAQLKNQDPMKPMQNGEFLSQMAQFGTVSGIQDLQKTMSGMANALGSNQALMASSLVGRAVLVPGDKVPYGAGVPVMAAAELPQAVSEMRVSIVDSSGQVVRQMVLGPQNAGNVKFSWDGLTDAGTQAAPGIYTVRADGLLNGKATALATSVVARVDSVSLGGTQGVMLNLWDGTTVPLANVKEIG
jgi:flagellar basal-body rod modification protein FlgD